MSPSTSPAEPVKADGATAYVEPKESPSSTAGSGEENDDGTLTKEGGTALAAIDDEDSLAADTPPPDADDPNLPTGLKLAVIVLALILSVFFFSLDQVSVHINGRK